MQYPQTRLRAISVPTSDAGDDAQYQSSGVAAGFFVRDDPWISSEAAL